MSDVKLDGGPDGTFLVLEGRAVHAAASDFMLDAPGRRKGPKRFRRALVHDDGDGLSINFDGDYAGGVHVFGVAEIVPREADLVVRGGISYEARTVKPEGGVGRVTISLDQELSTLHSQVAALSAKIATLEARP